MSVSRDELELERLRTEINKMIAETAKVNAENKFYPIIVGSTATLAIVAITKLFL